MAQYKCTMCMCVCISFTLTYIHREKERIHATHSVELLYSALLTRRVHSEDLPFDCCHAHMQLYWARTHSPGVCFMNLDRCALNVCERIYVYAHFLYNYTFSCALFMNIGQVCRVQICSSVVVCTHTYARTKTSFVCFNALKILIRRDMSA
jgi:hypothetical protein